MIHVIPTPPPKSYSRAMSDTFDLTRLGPPHFALDELADYIVDRHHRYVQGAIPAIRQALSLAVDHWGAAHAPLLAVQALFDELADELESHMAKEEHILFPAIRDLLLSGLWRTPMKS